MRASERHASLPLGMYHRSFANKIRFKNAIRLEVYAVSRRRRVDSNAIRTAIAALGARKRIAYTNSGKGGGKVALRRLKRRREAPGDQQINSGWGSGGDARPGRAAERGR
ncbi:hypothetical protein EVAR_43510_1 [Eumeta japonica]|uniref:Uncharacterized protein n=1 Tax=Eumeta variegata TaxID=151549 RepID=A0A4C1YKT6_EUMVA|nr:hypothetical protein EVAR_43510_1 [Eumeta japonica]